jgi:hypothetical protein
VQRQEEKERRQIMLAVAGGIVLAWFVLAFLPELLKLAWWLTKAAVLVILTIVPIAIVMGW